MLSTSSRDRLRGSTQDRHAEQLRAVANILDEEHVIAVRRKAEIPATQAEGAIICVSLPVRTLRSHRLSSPLSF